MNALLLAAFESIFACLLYFKRLVNVALGVFDFKYILNFLFFPSESAISPSFLSLIWSPSQGSVSCALPIMFGPDVIFEICYAAVFFYLFYSAKLPSNGCFFATERSEYYDLVSVFIFI